MKVLFAFLIAATAVACASIQPVAVQAGDLCLRCRRPIGDLRLAGEIVDSMNAPRPFRTAGCMARYVKTNAGTQFAAIFVTDYKSGRLLPASDAWFVPTGLTTPDGKKSEDDYLAFRSRGDAESFRPHSEPLLRWPQVVAEAHTN
jgi:hypothetical protein